MLSSFGKGCALILLWVLLACIYQACIRHNDCLVGTAASNDRKKDSVVRAKKFRAKKFKRRRLRLDTGDLEITKAKDLESQLNDLSIEVIDLKVRQGIPHGY